MIYYMYIYIYIYIYVILTTAHQDFFLCLLVLKPGLPFVLGVMKPIRSSSSSPPSLSSAFLLGLCCSSISSWLSEGPALRTSLNSLSRRARSARASRSSASRSARSCSSVIPVPIRLNTLSPAIWLSPAIFASFSDFTFFGMIFLAPSASLSSSIILRTFSLTIAPRSTPAPSAPWARSWASAASSAAREACCEACASRSACRAMARSCSSFMTLPIL
mmetsp:Transcript_39607/g.58234  ORF Transcript_39607/g.58234 Transcript_39607/m.58234 type:complete len:218 (-) Transcript_39607:220-873(-)